MAGRQGLLCARVDISLAKALGRRRLRAGSRSRLDPPAVICMWLPIMLSTGRWFVVRDRRLKDQPRREFLKHGAASVAFASEASAQAQADKLNAVGTS
jgi:hypothetical protein